MSFGQGKDVHNHERNNAAKLPELNGAGQGEPRQRGLAEEWSVGGGDAKTFPSLPFFFFTRGMVLFEIVTAASVA